MHPNGALHRAAYDVMSAGDGASLAALGQRLVLIPTFPTLLRPDGVAVNKPAAGVSIRVRPRTPFDVEPAAPT